MRKETNQIRRLPQTLNMSLYLFRIAFYHGTSTHAFHVIHSNTDKHTFLSIRVGSIFPLFQNHDQQLVYTIKGR